MNSDERSPHHDLLGEIKSRVRTAQHRAALSANAELIGHSGKSATSRGTFE